MLASVATIYGTLDGGDQHPTVAISGAMFLAAGATVAPLLPLRSMPAAIPRMGSTSPAVLAIAWGSAEAALIHLAVISQHLEEYWLYGWFFVAVGVAQMVSAYLVVARARRWVLWAIAAGNLVISAVWVLSRTYGAVLGPDATEPARAGFGDIVVTVLQVMIALVALTLVIRSKPMHEQHDEHGRELVNFSLALTLTLISTLALYSTVGGRPFVTHVG